MPWHARRPTLTFCFVVLLQTQLHSFHCSGAGKDESSIAFWVGQLHSKQQKGILHDGPTHHFPEFQMLTGVVGKSLHPSVRPSVHACAQCLLRADCVLDLL